jgi:hypothetical protein
MVSRLARPSGAIVVGPRLDRELPGHAAAHGHIDGGQESASARSQFQLSSGSAGFKRERHARDARFGQRVYPHRKLLE